MKTALITGSSRGIGKAIALRLAKDNYNIILNCRTREAEMNKLTEELKSFNKNIIGIKADLRNPKEIQKLKEKTDEKFGTVDILVNNAGISYVGLFTEMPESDMKNIMETNFYSVMFTTKIFAADMIRKKSGSIINISSIWGEQGASCETVYSASKGAVNSFTKALAKELGPSGIRVNAISAGVIETEMNDWLSENEKNILTEEIPLCRFGKPSEIAEMCAFLASDNSSYITGQIIGVNGGF